MERIMFEKNKAVITLTEEINFKSIHQLVRDIELIVNYYSFNRVKIEINSPGGELKALQLFIAKLVGWRKNGVVIETHAMSNVASAAAVMLSLGDLGYRTAMTDAEVLYHNVRVIGQMVITSDKARQLNEDLTRIDQKILNALMQHNKSCLESGFNQNEALPMQSIKIGTKTLKPKMNKTLPGYTHYVKSVYQDLFDMDVYLTAQQAVDLKLIDHVIAA